MKKAMIVLPFLSLVISSCGPTQQGIGMAEKPKVAVGAIAIGYEDNSNALKGLGTQLTKAIVKSGRYKAVDRSEEILRQLGEEHGYQRGGAVSEEQIKELGKQFSVQYMCIVQSTKVMNSYMLEARLVDVESAEIVNMGSVNNNLTNIEDLMRAAEELAQQLLGSSISGDTSVQEEPTSTPESENAPIIPTSAGGVGGSVLTDSRDGKRYGTIKIDNQVWMAKNLDFESDGSKCYNDNDMNCALYGRLYNWSTAKTVCPSGWHLPSKAEWSAMVAYIGGKNTAGKKLKAKGGWNNNGNGTDDYGFSALPGGYGSEGLFYGHNFYYVGDRSFWWSASEGILGAAYYRATYYNDKYAYGDYSDKSNLASVRCLLD